MEFSFFEDFDYLHRVIDIQVAGGLIGQQQGRGVDYGPSNADPLLLSPREFIWEALGFALQPHHFQGGPEATVNFFTGESLSPEDEGHVLLKRCAGELACSPETQLQCAAASWPGDCP